MARYYLVRQSDSKIVNVMEWDGDTSRWQPPVGHVAYVEGAPELVGLTRETPSVIDLSNLDNLDIMFKALAETVRVELNILRADASPPLASITRAQMKQKFLDNYNVISAL